MILIYNKIKIIYILLKMSEKTDFELSHVAFLVLGLVSEQPSHGKDINKKIEDRGMRSWTAIGKSSIYGVLKILKENKLVDSWIEEEDNRVIKIYKITEYGFRVLKNKVYNVLKKYYGRNGEDFYVAFSMIPLLSIDEQVRAISGSIKKLSVHIKELEDMLLQNSKMPLNVRGLFIHPIKVLKTDIEFLKEVLEEIKNGGTKYDKKASN